MKNKLLLALFATTLAFNAYSQDKDALLQSNPGKVTKLPPLMVDPALINSSSQNKEPSYEQMSKDLGMSISTSNQKNVYRAPAPTNPSIKLEAPPNMSQQ